MRSSIWSKRRISPSGGHRRARSSSVLFRASWTCATARVTDRPVPSSHGRARTTTIPPVGAGGPAWELPDTLWSTSTSTRAMTQASTANAPDFFSSLLDHRKVPCALLFDPSLSNRFLQGRADWPDCYGQVGLRAPIGEGRDPKQVCRQL